MKIDIILSADDKYASHMGIAITSILENNKRFNKIIAHILSLGISENNLEKLNTLKVKYSFFDYEIYDVEVIKKWMPKPKKGSLGETLGYGAFSRLFIHKFLDSDLDKVLYLDCDIIVDDDLYELYCIDLENNYCAGVLDIWNVRWLDELSMDKNSIYVNSGVLLLNLKKWRDCEIDKRFLELMSKPNTDLNDQNIINEVCAGFIKVLDLKYNFLNELFCLSYNHRLKDYWSYDEFEACKNNPTIIHYAGPSFRKPWVGNSETYLREFYLKYKEVSPWSNTPLECDEHHILQKCYPLFNKLLLSLSSKISLPLLKIGLLIKKRIV